MAERWEDFFRPGETLLWEGHPVPGVHRPAGLVAMSLFGLPFLVIGGGFCVVGLGMVVWGEGWEMSALGLFVALVSLPFAGVGIYLVAGQWIAAARAHRVIRYALTSRAAYVARAAPETSIECYPILPGTATSLEKGRHADTVWFHVRTEKDSDGDRSTTRVGFENIAEGEQVFALLRSIQMGTA